MSIDVELQSRTGEVVHRVAGESGPLADALPPESDEEPIQAGGAC